MATMTDDEILALLAGIKKFIKDRRPCVDSGWAPVKDGDITELSMILQAIIEAKWDADVDGDYPINWKFIDRTKCEPMHFRAVPYEHECETVEDAQCVLDALLTNVNVAAHNLEIWSRVQRDVRTLQDKREADAYPDWCLEKGKCSARFCKGFEYTTCRYDRRWLERNKQGGGADE